MKHIILLALLNMAASAVFAQQHIQLDNFKLTIPKEAKKISSQEKEKIKEGFSVQRAWEGSADHSYLLGSLLLEMRLRQDYAGNKKSLLEKQKMDTYLFKGNKQRQLIHSEIASFNGIKFLVVEYNHKGDYFIHFISENNASDRNLNGFIQCRPEYKADARQYLEQLLESIQMGK